MKKTATLFKFLPFLVLFTVGFAAKVTAQVNCANAAPFCTGTTYTFPNSTGTTSEAGPNYGCLLTQPNPVWYFLQIANSGNIDITMNQTSGGSGSDIDFICWGPFSSQLGNCGNLTAGNTIDCSYSTAATEVVNIPNAVTGEFYILVMTNYANTPGTITFSQTGGTGSTNCNVLCNITALSATPGACNSSDNSFSVSGVLSTTNPPSSGTLTIQSNCGGTAQVFTPPFATSINYTIPGIPSTGGGCQITASYSADATCTFTTNITAPAPCTVSCVASANNTGPYCDGSTVTLNGSGGGTYSWTGPNGFTSTAASPTLVASAAASGVYTVTITNGACSATATTSVTVDPNPTPAASNTGAYCEGTQIDLSANGGGTYSWTGPGGFTSTSQNPSITGSTTAMSGTYDVTVTVGSCTAVASTSVTVNPNPVPSASNTGAYCTGSQIDLSSSGGGTYSWSGPNGFTSTNQNPSIPNGTAAEAGTYTVIVTVGSCTASATTNVAVNSALVPTISSNGPLCDGSALNLNCANGVTWTWTGPNGFTSSSQSPIINPATTAESGTYSVTATDANGCSGSSTVSVTVNANPSVGVTATNICAGSSNGSATASASGGTAGYTYSWSPSGGTGATASGLTAGTYTVTVTDAAGCTVTGQATVSANPAITATVSASTITCTNTTGAITTTAAGGTPTFTYSWAPSGTGQNPTGLSAGTYTLTITDAANCTLTQTVAVTSNTVAPNANAGTDATLNCGPAANLNLSGGSSTAGVTYSWSGPGGFTSSSQNPNITATGQYTLTVTNPANGCTSTDVVDIDQSSINAAFTANPTGGYYPLTVDVINSSTNATTYAWSFGNGDFSTQMNDSTIYTAMGSYTITLIVTNPFGCIDSATAVINVVEPALVIVPNVFSPNGDGINDFFTIYSEGIAELKCDIFNRWGQKVNEIISVGGSWNGKTDSGSDAADGTYYYMLTAKGIDGSDISKEGYMLLTR